MGEVWDVSYLGVSGIKHLNLILEIHLRDLIDQITLHARISIIQSLILLVPAEGAEKRATEALRFGGLWSREVEPVVFFVFVGHGEHA